MARIDHLTSLPLPLVFNQLRGKNKHERDPKGSDLAARRICAILAGTCWYVACCFYFAPYAVLLQGPAFRSDLSPSLHRSVFASKSTTLSSKTRSSLEHDRKRSLRDDCFAAPGRNTMLISLALISGSDSLHLSAPL